MYNNVKNKIKFRLDSSLFQNFDKNLVSISELFDSCYPINNQNIKLGYTLCVGSRIGFYHTIIVQGDNYNNRTETIKTILAPISPSLICTIHGTSKEDLSRINSQHRILHIVNFKKSAELISLLTKSDKNGILYNGIKIQKLTIITDASYNQVPNEFKNNCLIIEACNNVGKINSLNYIPETSVEKIQSQINFTKECKAGKKFIESLDQHFQVDISTKKSIESKINTLFPKDTYFYRVFLDLVRITTFLNQRKRKSYIFKNQENESEERVYISEVEDIRWCIEVVKDIFIRDSLNLPDRYLEMVNYIIGWLTHDPVINESKANKSMPEDWDDYFEGMELIRDYLKYLRTHPDKKKFVRDERRFREYLLQLSDHKDKGKYKCLHFIQEGNKNKFKLIKAPLIKFFEFNKEDDEFYEEYSKFILFLKENREELAINLEFD